VENHLGLSLVSVQLHFAHSPVMDAEVERALAGNSDFLRDVIAAGADLVPIASRPKIAVIVLTMITTPGVRDIAKQNGAYECFVKQHTSGRDLDRAIQRAVSFVGQIPKEDRYRPI
jgi:hypothetical protein